MNTVTTTAPAFDQQGDLNDEARVDAAMRSFVSEFGVTAALHMESCVRCGLCAQACHFHVATGEAKYTPIHKLEPFRRAYLREASPFAPLVRALGLVKKPSIADLQHWQELLYDSCNMCGRCTVVCPMGIDIAELVKEARHGMFKAGLGEHTKALADAAKILNRIGARWTMHQGGFDASNIGFNNGDLELQERLTRALIDTAVKIGAKTVILPECGHAYGAARWEAAKWYGQALPVRIIHMTEFLDELIATQQIRLNKIGETVTFHDPCQIVRRGGLEAAARRVLAATGAKRFVTSCGQCRITLEMGAKHANWDKPAESLLELVADNLAD